MLDLLIHTTDATYRDPALKDYDKAYDFASNKKQGYIQIVRPTGWNWGKLELDPKRFIIARIEDHQLNPDWLKAKYDEFDHRIIDRLYRFPLEKMLTAGEFEALVNIPYNEKTPREPIIKTDISLAKIAELTGLDDQISVLKLHGSAGDFSIQEDGGGDYTALKTAVETEAADISGGSVDANFYISEAWASAETGGFDIDGWTMGSNNMLIQTQGDARGIDGTYNDNGTRYRRESGTGEIFDIEVPNVTVDGIQGKGYIITSGLGADYTIKNSIFNAQTGAGLGGIYISSGSSTGNVIENCVLFKDGGAESATGITSHGNFTGTLNIKNCTVSGYNIGINRVGGTYLVTNCAVFNNGDDFYGTQTIAYCASDDGDGTNAVDISPGGTESDGWDAAFTDWSNGDFSIKDTDSVLYNAGTNTGAPSTDIIGTSRPQATTVDIGAFEFLDESGVLPIEFTEQAQTIDNLVLVQHNVLSINPINQPQSIGNIDLITSINLIVDKMIQNQNTDNINLIQHNIISVDGSEQSQVIENLDLVVAGVLEADSTTQGQILGDLDLLQHNILAIDKLEQIQEMDNIDLIIAGVLSIAPIIQAQNIDTIVIIQHNNLVVAGIDQPQELEQIILDTGILLQISEIIQNQSIDNLGLTQANILEIDELLQGQEIDNIILSIIGEKIVITLTLKSPSIDLSVNSPGINLEVE